MIHALVETFEVRAFFHPFNASKRDHFYMGVGCTVEDAILEAAYRAGMPPSRFADGVVIQHDTKVPKVDWMRARPKAGDDLILKSVPGEPFSIISLVTAIAAYSVTPASIAALTGVAVSSTFALTVSVGISIVGPLVPSSLRPSPL